MLIIIQVLYTIFSSFFYLFPRTRRPLSGIDRIACLRKNHAVYCDAHIHPVDLADRDPQGWNILPAPSWRGAVVAHDPEEYSRAQLLRRQLPPTLNGFGIHPQNPRRDTMEFLSRLAAEGEIDYVGEAGFDFFGDTPLRIRNDENLQAQKMVFEFQLSLAARHGLPLVIHARKAMDIVLGYGHRLGKLPAVIFHSWPGRIQDANAILKQGTNAYFSFGTTLLRDAKHALESCSLLMRERILSETDAPWQPPKSSTWTDAAKIVVVVGKIAKSREISAEETQEFLADNFFAAFGMRI